MTNVCLLICVMCVSINTPHGRPRHRPATRRSRVPATVQPPAPASATAPCGCAPHHGGRMQPLACSLASWPASGYAASYQPACSWPASQLACQRQPAASQPVASLPGPAWPYLNDILFYAMHYDTLYDINILWW